MPKIKTHRGAAKRFKLTARGKVKRSHAFSSHRKSNKTSKRKRNLRKGDLVAPANLNSVKRQLGIG